MEKNRSIITSLIFYICLYNIMLFIGIAIGCIIVIKYEALKKDYKKAESDKIEYCKKYNELKSKVKKDSLVIATMEKDYIEQWEENQIFSSMLSEIESEPGGHKILKKLWDKESN